MEKKWRGFCCSAWNCSNRQRKRSGKTSERTTDITLHLFPTDPERCAKWMAAMKRKDFRPSSTYRLCSQHFTPDDFTTTMKRRRLKSNAVPSIFAFPSHLQLKQKALTTPKPASPASIQSDQEEDTIENDQEEDMIATEIEEEDLFQSIPEVMEGQTSVVLTVCSAIDRADSSLRALSLDIWNNPELCFEEHHAHKVLTDYLAGKGFTVTKHYKLETAFKADFFNTAGDDDKESVHVGVMCEYDALPGIGHACGHNLIAILGVAIALGVKEAMEKGQVVGKLTVLGTPAEEGGGGKIDLINAGAFKDFDIALMAHPAQRNLTRPVYVAQICIDVEYEGKASHAASFPWAGVNALDAAVLCYQNVSCMRQHMKPSWRVHGIITNGGEKPNIIPEKACLQYYARTLTLGELEELKQKLIGCFEGAARASGCQVKYTFLPKPYHPLNSNPTLASLYQKHGESLGIRFESDPKELMKQGGSTDMGNVSWVVPSLHPKYALQPTAPGHTKDFREIAGTDKSHSITLTHAKSLALTAVDVMQKTDVCHVIRKEFKESLRPS